LPLVRCEFAPVPAKGNPLGVKGGSEAGNMAAPAAVVNALIDALSPLGVTDLPLPATASRVWQVIENIRRAGTAMVAPPIGSV
jgi:carbon-monoxide dehydrogenase large subunit